MMEPGMEALAGVTDVARTLRVSGIVTGIVTDIKDPEGLGRIKVVFPIFGIDTAAEGEQQTGIESAWAPVGTFYAGAKHGGYFLPEVDDEVLVAFYLGDVNRPYVVGSVWNGKDRPLQDNADGKNNIKEITTRSGLSLRFTDTPDAQTIEIYDEAGKEQITISKKDQKITLQSQKEILLTSSSGEVNISAENIKVSATSSLTLEGQTISIKGEGKVSVEGGSVDVTSNGLVAVKGSTINLN